MIDGNQELTILLYHGVTQVDSMGIENYSGKHIKTDSFREQMTYIKNHCQPLSMDTVIDHYQSQIPFPNDAVAVTFDDGFKNNFTDAFLILSEMNIPATFYVTTGFIDTDQMFWVDIIEDSINRTQKDELTITLEGQIRHFPLNSNSLKISAIQSIKGYCKKVKNDEKNQIIRDLKEFTKVNVNVHSCDNYLKMTWDDISEINRHPLMTIGGHTISHEILTSLSQEDMEMEITQSISTLINKCECPIRHYSYPEGQVNHFNNEVIECLKESGIVCCPTALDGVNTLSDDLFHLKRIMPSFMGREFPFSQAMVRI